MKKNVLFLLVFLFVSANAIFAQTKVSGVVVDKQNQPIPFANVVFKGSSEGIVTNEDGRFYLESQKSYITLIISSVGFSEKEITLDKAVNYNFKIQLSEAESLNEVVVFAGKTSKKDNPALDILRKIWERNVKWTLLYDQYQMEKYEK